MKLGIVVVYLVRAEDEKLLDLHLSQIEKHTLVPYTVYGSVSRLLPKFRHKLEQHPKVKICECPTTDLREGDEHAFYLEHLVRIAIEDGVSHVVTLHVDSFPIRSGWAKELAGKLSESCVIATIMGKEDFPMFSACLFFHRDFYLKYHPSFLLSEAEHSTPKFRQYRQEYKHEGDSGIGYTYKVHAEGLSWYPLLRSGRSESYSPIGSMYSDLVFHLVGAVRFGDRPLKSTFFLRNECLVRFLSRVKHLMKPITPRRVRDYFHAPVARMTSEPMFQQVRTQFLDDPESYLNCLRTGEDGRT